MKKYTQAELSEILDRHSKWLRGEEDGERADLSNTDLSGMDLSGVNLHRAVLIKTNLSGTILTGADMSEAILTGSDLSFATLFAANLSRSSLARANMTGAILRRTNMTGAKLSGSDLSRTDLTDSIVAGSVLSNAALSHADLSGTDLSGVVCSHNKHLISACLGNYQMVMFRQRGTVLVTAGCRQGLTIAEARERWAEGNEKRWTEQTAEYGARQRAMLEFLVAQAELLGWPVHGTEKEQQA